MPIQASCPTCDKEYKLADHLDGKQIRCKECNAVFRVSEANRPAGTKAPAVKTPTKSGSNTAPPLSKEAAKEKRTAQPPRDESDEDRPPTKGRKAGNSRRPSDKKVSGKRKKKGSGSSLPNELRNAMALLIFVGFIQIVGVLMIRHAAADLYLTSTGETLLTVTTVLGTGMGCAALAAAFLLRAGMWLGRLLSMLVAILSILLAVGVAISGNSAPSDFVKWALFAMWLGIGVSILQFADSKGVREYVRRKNEANRKGEDEEGSDLSSPWQAHGGRGRRRRRTDSIVEMRPQTGERVAKDRSSDERLGWPCVILGLGETHRFTPAV